MGDIAEGRLQGCAQSLLAEAQIFPETGGDPAQSLVALRRLGIHRQIAKFVGKARQDAQALFLVDGFSHPPGRHPAHAADDQLRETPAARDPDPKFLKTDAQHLLRRAFFRTIFLLDDTANFLAFVRKIETAEQASETLEHRADEHLFDVARRRAVADVAGQDAGQGDQQELLFKLVGIGAVLEVLEEHHGDRDVAHRVEPEDQHGTRDGADVAAAGLAEVGRIDQPQDFVGEREVAQDRLRQVGDALFVRSGDLVDRAHRFRKRRKIALVAHAPEKEIDRALTRLARNRFGFGLKEFSQGVAQLVHRVVTVRRVARHCLMHDGGQGFIDVDVFRKPNVLAHQPSDDLPDRSAIDGPPSDQHFIKHQSCGEDVAALGALAQFKVLGRHVIRRSDQGFRAIAARLAAHGNAEIHDPWRPVGGDQDIVRLEVAMNDPRSMRMRHRVEDRNHDPERLHRRQTPLPAQVRAQVLAGDVFEHQIKVSALLAGLEDGHDVRVAQGADHPRLDQ